MAAKLLNYRQLWAMGLIKKLARPWSRQLFVPLGGDF